MNEEFARLLFLETHRVLKRQFFAALYSPADGYLVMEDFVSAYCAGGPIDWNCWRLQ